MLNTPEIFRLTKDFQLGPNDPKLDKQLDNFNAYGVFVQNNTAQWLYLPDVGIFIPPNGVGSIPLGGTQKASAYFSAPPGVVQPGGNAQQRALLFFVAWPVAFSVTVAPTQLQSVTQLERFTKATLPAAGSTGRLVLLTDYDRSVWKDTGTSFVSLEAERFNVKQFGALGDGVTLDDAAFAAAIAALPTAGGVIVCPPGVYQLSAQLDLRGKFGVTLEGTSSGESGGALVPAVLRFTQAGAGACINLQSSGGVTIRNLMIQWTNAAFTGRVIDARGGIFSGSDCSRVLVEDCVITHSGGAGIPAACLDLNKCIISTIRRVAFETTVATTHIFGAAVGGYSDRKSVV